MWTKTQVLFYAAMPVFAVHYGTATGTTGLHACAIVSLQMAASTGEVNFTLKSCFRSEKTELSQNKVYDALYYIPWH